MNRQKNILYVDDEMQNLRGFKVSFYEDFNIQTASSAKQALEILSRNNIQVVISDQRMPEITGLELFKTVARQYPEIICIILTAYMDIEATIEAVNHGGIYRYMMKPWDVHEMKMTIDNALEAYYLRIENSNLLNSLQEKNEQLKIQVDEYAALNEEYVIQNGKLYQAKVIAEENEKKLAEKNSDLLAAEEELQSANEELIATSDALRESNNHLKEAKERAEENERKFRSYIENAPEGVFLVNKEGKYLEINNAACNICGYSKEELLQMSIPQLLDPTYLNSAIEHFKTVVEVGRATGEFRYLRKDGSHYYLTISAVKLAENLFLGFGKDTTERVELIKNLKKAKDEAVESNRLKTEFINNMSHEIRTPMNGILGFSEFLTNPELTPERRQQYINIIINSSHQLLRIIDDILEISALGTKQVKAVEKKVCLNDLLFDLFIIFDLKAKERKVPLYIKKDLSDHESTIYTDATKLNKILSNLLENAIKFTTKGFIEINYRLVENNLEICVIDSGIGIAAEKQNIIFEKFAKEEEKMSQDYGGLGLGLAIAKENTELLGGHIEVKSQKDKGATFIVTIPYKPFYADVIEKMNTQNNEHINENKHKIIIAEDDEINYLYISIMLQNSDSKINIIHADNGEQAIKLCSENPDARLVLMDIKMPKLNGYDAVRKIKENNPALPIIAVTAYSSIDDQNKAFDAGCDDFIPKPISQKTIENILDKYLKN